MSDLPPLKVYYDCQSFLVGSMIDPEDLVLVA